MEKRIPKKGLTFYYRRDNSPGLHVRDLYGGHHVLIQCGGRWIARALSSPPPDYNRFDRANAGRSTRGLHPDLPAMFENADPGCILDSPETHLPGNRQNSRRVPQQGMREAMDALFPAPAPESASQYAQRIGTEGRHEWCHLIAHSMGGADGPGNVVAGARFNNSEQLIIENLLSSYLRENLFTVQVSARLLDSGKGRYMGRAIRYVIRDGEAEHVVYLDCATANRPTQIHLEVMSERIARWLNLSLLHNSTRNVSRQELQDVLDDCPEFARDTGSKRHRPDDDTDDGPAHIAPAKKKRAA